jgi:hypothetical protein
MSLGPVDSRSDPDLAKVRRRHWVQWALFVAALAIILMVALVGTDARKPWVFALF